MQRNIKFDNMNDDPGFYKFGIFYFNRNDERFIIPKVTKLGYTVNFAKPYAYLFLSCIIFIVLMFTFTL